MANGAFVLPGGVPGRTPAQTSGYHTEMPFFFISTYVPLISTRAGREAAAQYAHPPFIDGSIRREPDLEAKYPSISCLCRTDKFAPRLKKGDFVAYMTRKGRYGDVPISHRRLTAVLQVKEVFGSHKAAASWYRARKLKLPKNCFVPGNRPLPLSHSHRMFDSGTCVGDRRTQKAWDAEYRQRSNAYSTFVVCKKTFRDLSWNPGALKPRDLKKLLKVIGLRVSFPEPCAIGCSASLGAARRINLSTWAIMLGGVSVCGVA